VTKSGPMVMIPARILRCKLRTVWLIGPFTSFTSLRAYPGADKVRNDEENR